MNCSWVPPYDKNNRYQIDRFGPNSLSSAIDRGITNGYSPFVIGFYNIYQDYQIDYDKYRLLVEAGTIGGRVINSIQITIDGQDVRNARHDKIYDDVLKAVRCRVNYIQPAAHLVLGEN